MKNTMQLNLKAIVSNSFDTEAYDETFATVKERALFVLECFETEFNHPYEIKRITNLEQRIGSWLQGLPSVCTVPFYNYHIIELGKEFHSLSVKATDKKQAQYLEGWFVVMASTIIKLANMKDFAAKSFDEFDCSKVDMFIAELNKED